MRRHPPAWLAWPLAALSLLVVAGGVAAVWRSPQLAEALYWESTAVYLADALWLLGAPVVGAILAARRPEHPYGWILLSLGVSAAAIDAAAMYGTFALLVADAALPFGWAATWLAHIAWIVMILHLPFLLLLFPDGRLPSPRWRWLVRAVLGLAALMFLAGPLVPGQMGVVPVHNPLGLEGSAGAAATAVLVAAVFGLFAAIVAAAVSVFTRRRRAGPQERLQLRWFAYAAGLFGVVLAGTGGGAYLITDPLASAVLSTLTMNAVFAAIGVAVLRYRLYEIDRLVSRTVTYALLTGLLAGVYVIGVLLLPRLLAPFATGSELSVAGATLVAAALFMPARRRIQSVVDRRFNRARYDAEQVVARFRDELRDEWDLTLLSSELVEVVGRTVQPARASLWLRRRGLAS